MDFEKLTSLPCLWDVLAAERRPILLYGTGNGADKILDEMMRRGIPCAGVFASDGFVRERDFRGMRVTSYSDAIGRFGEDIVILVAFGSSREDVLERIEALAARHTLFVPDVPLFADDPVGELFTPGYARSHRSEIERTAALLEDDGSRELFFEVLAYRLTGEMKYLRRTEPFALSVAECVPGDVSRVVDCGAFTGDTARVFLAAFPEAQIVCVEPDARSFRRLSELAAEERRVTAVNASVGETEGIDVFNASASRASSTAAQNRRAKQIEVRRVTLDMLIGDEILRDLPDEGRLFLKLDVEGAETSALRGARRTLADERTAVAAAVYHRTGDIFTIPALLAEAMPQRRFSLRRSRCLPGWELTLFAY